MNDISTGPTPPKDNAFHGAKPGQQQNSPERYTQSGTNKDGLVAQDIDKPLDKRTLKKSRVADKKRAMEIGKELINILADFKKNIQNNNLENEDLIEKSKLYMEELNNLLFIEDRSTLKYTFDTMLEIYENNDTSRLIMKIDYFSANLQTSIRDNDQSILGKLYRLFRAINRFFIKEKSKTILDVPTFNKFMKLSLKLKPNITLTDKVLGKGVNGQVNLGTLYDPISKTTKNVAIKTLQKTPETAEGFKKEVSMGIQLGKISDYYTKTLAAFDNKKEKNYQIVMELGDINLNAACLLFNENPTPLPDNNDICGQLSEDVYAQLPNDIIASVVCARIDIFKYFIHDNISMMDCHSGNILLFFDQNKMKVCDYGYVNNRNEEYKGRDIKPFAADITDVFRAVRKKLSEREYLKNLNEKDDFDEKYINNILQKYFISELDKVGIKEDDKQAFINDFNFLVIKESDLYSQMHGIVYNLQNPNECPAILH